jgi:predicted DNA-binding transcriptional regulator AlpA
MEDLMRRFTERQSYWLERGFAGPELYRHLATDPELPLYFSEREAAELAGLSPSSLTTRRARKMAPSYIAHSSKRVRYPRADLMTWLADMFCDRRAS